MLSQVMLAWSEVSSSACDGLSLEYSQIAYIVKVVEGLKVKGLTSKI